MLVGVVQVDVLGFPSVLGDRARKLVPRIPAKNILIGSTHTHSAPDCYGFPERQGRTHRRPEVHGFRLQARSPRRSTRRSTTCKPATIKIATGEAKGKIAYNYYAPDLYDRRMSVIQAIGPDGKAIATLVNYAVHPEVLGNDVGILSPDLVGPLCDKIEAQVGGIGDLHERGAGRHDHRRQPRSSTQPTDPTRPSGTTPAPGTNACASAI